MNLHITENYETLSRYSADVILETIRRKPDAVLGMPTGSTPLGMFKLLIESGGNDPSLWNQVRIVCLDDYFGIARDDERSFFSWQCREYIDPLGISHDRVLRIDPSGDDPEKACAAFEQTLKQWGGLDLTVLGLGLNGHIGFNEPGSAVDGRSHLVQLTEETIRANATYWGGDESRVPTHGVTMGVGTMLESRSILMMVSGKPKAEILKQVIEGAESAQRPASFLRRADDVTIVADRPAASLLADSNN